VNSMMLGISSVTTIGAIFVLGCGGGSGLCVAKS